MHLSALCQEFTTRRFPIAGDSGYPDELSVRHVREAVTRALCDSGEFLLDCIELELDSLQDCALRQGLVPFLHLAPFGIKFAFGYWRPGATETPHEHTAWTVTAVCRNQLDVLTFDRTESYLRSKLVPKNRFAAIAGRAGYIYAPGIHAPRNHTSQWSLSLHLISPNDGQRTGLEPELPFLEKPEPLSELILQHPSSNVGARRQRNNEVSVLSTLLLESAVPRSTVLLQRCAAVAPYTLERRILDALRAPETQRQVLTRTHPDLRLTIRDAADSVSLYVDTLTGPRSILTTSAPAISALRFAVEAPYVDIREIPGQLSDDERLGLVDALERTGVFFRQITG
jgi:hypothetical protein